MALGLAVTAAACTSPEQDAGAVAVVSSDASPSATTTPTATTPTATSPTNPSTTTPPLTRPEWLGQRTLPTLDNGFAPAQDTPPELVDRELPTIDTLPPPPDETFAATIAVLAGEPLARSTWVEGCPVPAEQLRYITVTFWGFDDRHHTGELIVHEDEADNIVAVFAQLHAARFPIEEMRIVTPADLDALPTGDGNNTASFVCRAVTGGSRFSEHAYGLAIDINPFHNPYIRGQLVLPELASSFLAREALSPGMIGPDSIAVEAFAAVGWEWGGDWNSLKDYQHFALHNR